MTYSVVSFNAKNSILAFDGLFILRSILSEMIPEILKFLLLSLIRSSLNPYKNSLVILHSICFYSKSRNLYLYTLSTESSK